jgi:hypothetical protein
MSLTKCNADTTRKFPFAVNTATGLKDIPNTSDNTGIILSQNGIILSQNDTILSQNLPRQMPILSGEFDIFCSSISVSNSKWAICGLCHYCIR